eukprot:361767-Chlamydomonas_euryale.AAC.15
MVDSLFQVRVRERRTRHRARHPIPKAVRRGTRCMRAVSKRASDTCLVGPAPRPAPRPPAARPRSRLKRDRRRSDERSAHGCFAGRLWPGHTPGGAVV